MHPESSRRDYFEELSARWDGFTDGERVRMALRSTLSGIPINPSEHIVDLGCGTGNLSMVLLEMLGPAGKVTAVDFSEAMVRVARVKIDDARVRWLVADVTALSLSDDSVDRVICFSAWPHFPDPHAAACQIRRILKPGGALHILHIDSRAKINAVHGGVGGAIGRDFLPPAHELVQLLSISGFAVREAVDADDAYIIRATKGVHA